MDDAVVDTDTGRFRGLGGPCPVAYHTKSLVLDGLEKREIGKKTHICLFCW